MRPISIILEKMMGYANDAISFVERLDKEAFFASRVNQYAVSLAILQIGELVGALPEEYQTTHAHIPWRRIRGMRNMIAHDYVQLDLSLLWETAKVDLPELIGALEALAREKKPDCT